MVDSDSGSDSDSRSNSDSGANSDSRANFRTLSDFSTGIEIILPVPFQPEWWSAFVDKAGQAANRLAAANM